MEQIIITVYNLEKSMLDESLEAFFTKRQIIPRIDEGIFYTENGDAYEYIVESVYYNQNYVAGSSNTEWNHADVVVFIRNYQ
jgi:hypothetical protein